MSTVIRAILAFTVLRIQMKRMQNSFFSYTETSDEEAGIVVSVPASRRRPPAARRRRRLSTGRSLTGSEHGDLLAIPPTDEEGSCSVVDTR